MPISETMTCTMDKPTSPTTAHTAWRRFPSAAGRCSGDNGAVVGEHAVGKLVLPQAADSDEAARVFRA